MLIKILIFFHPLSQGNNNDVKKSYRPNLKERVSSDSRP